MTQREVFMQSIIESPQDDSPRLIFADWLEENGESERAEFIRVQCELERTPTHTPGCPAREFGVAPGHCRRCALAAKTCYLFEHALPREAWKTPDDWFISPMSPAPSRWPTEDFYKAWVFVNRGFIAEITCTAAAFAEHGAEILRSQPVEKVTLTNYYPLERFMTFPFVQIRKSSLREICLAFQHVGRVTIRNYLAEELPGITINVRDERETIPDNRPPDYLVRAAHENEWIRNQSGEIGRETWQFIDIPNAQANVMVPCLCQQAFPIDFNEPPVSQTEFRPTILTRHFFRNAQGAGRIAHHIGQCSNCNTIYWTRSDHQIDHVLFGTPDAPLPMGVVNAPRRRR